MSDVNDATIQLAIVGAGPAGLMAAEVASAAGVSVDVYEGKGSVGRKFLIAGKGGLNLTHAETFASFITRYGSRREQVSRWLDQFSADAVRDWARQLGIETFVGTSGRVFPQDLKAAPLLRAWVRRLRQQGVRFHVNHYCEDLYAGTLRLRTPPAERVVRPQATVLALGGGSWPHLGSDGRWVSWLRNAGVGISELQPSNCGFDVGWSPLFAERHAGHPVKSVRVCMSTGGPSAGLQGEFVITASGIEGSVIYALAAALRAQIHRHGSATIELDLAPDHEVQRLLAKLSQPRAGRSLTEHVRRGTGIEGVKMGLLYEVMQRADMADPGKLAGAIKALPLKLVGARPLAESISSAGGVRFSALDEHLMIRALPGVFCAGEMIDWEAPTGGYLLTACFASGRIAGHGVVEWLRRRQDVSGARTA